MKIAYIMSRFPHLPETFILREMNILDDKGVDIQLYPLIFQQTSHIHKAAQRWMQRAHRTSYFSFRYIKSFFYFLTKKPFKITSLLFNTLVHSISNLNYLIKCLLLFPKAVFLADQFKIEQIDHIHVHYATFPAYVAWIISQLSDITYSVTVHAHDIYVHQTMLKQKLNQATRIIAISEFNKNFLLSKVSPDLSDKIKVIHCGITIDAYQHKMTEYDPQHQFNIMSIGSLQPYKGQIYLIKACQQLAEQGIKVNCSIIGEGELRESLSTYIEQNKIKNVTLLGAKTEDQIAELFKSNHCYIQPSIITETGKMEGIPVSIMEAMASKTVVIATDISGIPEIVIQNKTGYIIPEKEYISLKTEISYIINNYSQNIKITDAALEHVKNYFNLETNSKKLLKEFTDIVEG
jgi:glycosyltransferase involved in cell wall biosynthesis